MKQKYNISTDNDELFDAKLKAAFHKLPDAPENPWFVRKVMNRLPARQIRQYTFIEYFSYLLAIVGVAIGWFYYGGNVLESGVLKGHDLLAIITLAVLSVFVPANFVAPLVKRWIK